MSRRSRSRRKGAGSDLGDRQVRALLLSFDNTGTSIRISICGYVEMSGEWPLAPNCVGGPHQFGMLDYMSSLKNANERKNRIGKSTGLSLKTSVIVNRDDNIHLYDSLSVDYTVPLPRRHRGEAHFRSMRA